MALTLKNLTIYTPEYYDLMIQAIYLQTEDGLDWYLHLNRFQPDTLKICFDEKGVIRSYHTDASRLYPLNLSVTEVNTTDVPDGLNITGDWMWNGEKIIPREFTRQEKIDQAEAHRSELIAAAGEKIAPLQDASDLGITTKLEADQLMAWKSYRVKLNRLVFTNDQEISWPSPPEV